MTQPMKGAPSVKLAIQNTLVSYLTTQLTNVWSAWAAQDAIDAAAGLNPPLLVNPQRITRGPRKLTYSTPDISIVVTDAQVMPVEGGMLNAPNETGWTSWHYSAVVVVTCSSSDELALDEMVDRYLVALWEVFAQHPQLDGTTLMGGIGAYVMGTAKGGPVKLQTQQNLTQEGGLLLSVRTDESA